MICLARPGRGHTHDDRLLKPALSPAVDGLTDLQVVVDWGSRGMPADSHGDQMEGPHTKPRTRKNPPPPQGTEAQKAAHKTFRRVRILVEHAMGGIPRYTLLGYGCRNRTATFADDVIGIGAGRWHLVLSY